MRFRVFLVLTLFALLGCAGSDEQSPPLLTDTQGSFYSGSVDGFGESGFAHVRLVTGANPKLEVSTFEEGVMTPHRAAATVEQSGEALVVRSTLPDLGPVTLSGTVRPDVGYVFDFKVSGETFSGEAKRVGKLPVGLENTNVKEGYYQFEVDAVQTKEFSLDPGNLNFNIRNIRLHEDEGADFDVVGSQDLGFRELQGGKIVGEEMSVGSFTASWQVTLPDNFWIILYLTWSLDGTGWVDYTLMSIKESSGGQVRFKSRGFAPVKLKFSPR